MTDHALEEVPRRVWVGEAPLDLVSLDEVVRLVDRHVAQRQPLRHVAVNAAKVVQVSSDRELRQAVSESDIATADGQPVAWAARLLGHGMPPRVAGIDLMEALLEHAASVGYHVYFFGAREHVVTELVDKLCRRYPALRIAGFRNGYYAPEEEPAIVEEIRQSGADLLFVALGTPQKEIFLARHHDRLAVPFRMGVGGAFDVMVGEQRRAPRWMQRIGLEWLFRFAQEPRRLWRRYLIGNAQFIALVCRELMASRRN